MPGQIPVTCYVDFCPSGYAALAPFPFPLSAKASIQFWLSYTQRIRRLGRGPVVIEWPGHAFGPAESDWFGKSLVRPMPIGDAPSTEPFALNFTQDAHFSLG